MNDSRQEAEGLAAKTRAYWSARGKCPRVWVQQEAVIASKTSERLMWVVRSNMVGGWPLAGPRQRANPSPDSISDSLVAVSVLAAVRHRETENWSVRLSNRVWHDKRKTA
jgi:hypothetical protein